MLMFKKMFVGLLGVCTIKSFSGSLPSNYKEPIKCVSLNNQLCQSRPTLIDINSHENLFHPFVVSVYNCGEVVALLMIHMLEYLFQIE